jgi:hypothetical protein
MVEQDNLPFSISILYSKPERIQSFVFRASTILKMQINQNKQQNCKTSMDIYVDARGSKTYYERL